MYFIYVSLEETGQLYYIKHGSERIRMSHNKRQWQVWIPLTHQPTKQAHWGKLLHIQKGHQPAPVWLYKGRYLPLKGGGEQVHAPADQLNANPS